MKIVVTSRLSPDSESPSVGSFWGVDDVLLDLSTLSAAEPYGDCQLIQQVTMNAGSNGGL